MKVLVVEDNPVNMKLLMLVLKKYGHEAIPAINGTEGVEKAVRYHPDLILMDIMLPDITGLEATKQIREIKNMADVKIIAITSYAMSGDREKIIQAGCNGYFEKPIDPLKIMEDIQKMIGENP
ncbi:MAG: response regulator [Candidatus Methanoperedens sp.]|nr:response regulator [Candidatus Methanoperedens sp.]MCE8426889.1 response regulator [Candidatus Methanoperedens sp.]